MATLRQVFDHQESKSSAEKIAAKLRQEGIRRIQKEPETIYLDFPKRCFLCFNIKAMVKPKLPKIFKVKKDKENDDQFIVRWKNMDKKQIKEFRKDLDEYCKAYQQRASQDFCNVE